MSHIPTIHDIVSSQFPGLMKKIEAIIEESERQYCKQPHDDADSFLWEHSVHVASLAAKLSVLEEVDPLLPVIAALLHDCGKFHCGCYHEDDTPEEAHAATKARQLLEEAGMAQIGIREVIDSLTALYNDAFSGNSVTDIIHDADFLVKAGPMGVAGFFTKAALRGRSLQRSIIECLSKELTYAFHLPANMRTAAGRKLAVAKKTFTFSFYEALIDDLRQSNSAHYAIRRFQVADCRSFNSTIEIHLVVPESCFLCGGLLNPEFSTRKDIKCTKLIARSMCENCGDRKEISFCLPEIGKRS